MAHVIRGNRYLEIPGDGYAISPDVDEDTVQWLNGLGVTGNYGTLAGSATPQDATVGHGGDGWNASNSRQWLSGTITNLNTATSSVTLIAYVAAADWTPAATSYMCGWSNGCELGLDTAGTVRVRVDQSDATARTVSSSAATGFTDGTAHWVAAVLTDAGASGTCSFYTSENDVLDHPGADPTTGDWTLLGTANRTVTTWNGTYRSVTQAVLGNYGGLQGWSGKIYYASGAINNSTPIWEVVFANETQAATSIVDQNGNTFTATGTSISVVRAVGTTTWRARLSLDDTTPGTSPTVLAHYPGTSNRSWRVMIATDGSPRLVASINGTTDPIDQQGTALGYADNQPFWVEIKRTLNGLISYRKSADDTYDHSLVSWSSAGSDDSDDVGPLFRQTGIFEAGSSTTGTADLLVGKLYAWVMLDGAGTVISGTSVNLLGETVGATTFDGWTAAGTAAVSEGVGDLDVRVLASTNWDTTSTQTMFAQLAEEIGYSFYGPGSTPGTLDFSAWVEGNLTTATSSAHGVDPFHRCHMRATREWTTGLVSFFTNDTQTARPPWAITAWTAAGTDSTDPGPIVMPGLDALLSARDTQLATILAIGDSITEGWSASDPSLRWIQLLQDELRTRFPVTGNDGLGYLPAWRNATFDAGAVPTLAGNAIGKINAGPGYRSLQIGQTVGELSWFALVGDGGTWTITYQGDTTNPLDWDIDKDLLMAEMNALPSINGDIVAISAVTGVFDPLFPQSNHWFPQWDVSAGNITPGTVDGTNLTSTSPDPASVQWLTWSNAGIAGTCTYENLDADMIDVWLRYSAFTNNIVVNVDGLDVQTFTTASGGGDHDSNHHYVVLGPGTHDVEFREDDVGGFPAQLDGIFAYKGDGPTDGYMQLNGNARYSCPDSAPLSITGDLELRWRVRADDYTPSADVHIVSHWDSLASNNRGYRFGVNSSGNLFLSWSPDGTAAAALTATSTAPSFVDGTDYWVRVTFDVNDGGGNRVISFYKSSDTTYDHTAVSWSLINTVTTAGVTSIFDTNSEQNVGAILSGAPGYWTGRVYAGAVLSGIGGTVVADPNFDVGAQRDPDAAGNNWTPSVTPGMPSFETENPPFGVHVACSAKGGGTAHAFARGGTGDDPAVTDIADWVTGFQPVICTLAFGVNDWSTGVPPWEYKADMQIIIDGLRDADAGLPIVLIPWFEPHPAYHYVPTYDYSDYVDAQYELETENPNVTLINFWVDPVGTGYENNASWRPADVPGGLLDTNLGFGLHPGDVGSAQIATKILAELDVSAVPCTIGATVDPFNGQVYAAYLEASA
jgi:hypothetical protein